MQRALVLLWYFVREILNSLYCVVDESTSSDVSSLCLLFQKMPQRETCNDLR